MNHAPLRILTGAAALVLSVSLLTSAAVPVRSLPAASGEETVLARPSLQDQMCIRDRTRPARYSSSMARQLPRSSSFHSSQAASGLGQWMRYRSK